MRSLHDRNILYHAAPSTGNCYDLDGKTGAFFYNTAGFLLSRGWYNSLDSMFRANVLLQPTRTLDVPATGLASAVGDAWRRARTGLL